MKMKTKNTSTTIKKPINITRAQEHKNNTNRVMKRDKKNTKKRTTRGEKTKIL